MKSKIKFILLFILSILPAINTVSKNERKIWVESLIKISDPIIRNLALDSLNMKMPIYNTSNQNYQYLEALGRVVCGIAPWLELENDTTTESTLRETYRNYTIQAISNSVNPHAKDYMNFSDGNQPLVDAAYLAQGLLRAPNGLWKQLSKQTRHRVVEEMKKTRNIKPKSNNWLLFASVVEAFLLEYTGECDANRLQGGR